jgi:hypothetical protein
MTGQDRGRVGIMGRDILQVLCTGGITALIMVGAAMTRAVDMAGVITVDLMGVGMAADLAGITD